jgi:predicted nucleotidyltransferase
MPRPKITISKGKISKFCKKNHISTMSLFGSVLTDQFNSTSDVDFLVEFKPEHIPTLFDIVSMEEELSNIIGRHADLRTAKGISRYFRDDVIATAHRIYG